jgi:phosphotransferase system enzyme I (PtsI)
MQTINVIPVSPGVVIGRIFIQESERRRVARRQVPPEQVPSELARLGAALAASIAELGKVRKDTEEQMGADTANIFLFHMGMLADKSLVVPLNKLVTDQLFTAEYAVQRTFTEWAQRFRAMKDSAFVTKANDLEDLSSRVLRHLIGEHTGRLKDMPHEAVVIASDLTPSQAAGFDRNLVEAFATEFGGRTSHTAIVARALGIPAVVGCPDLMELATDGTPIVVDGDRGMVIIDPTLAQLDEYHSYLEQQKLFQLSLEEVASLPAVTRDGVHIHLCGNIEFPDEIETVVRLGGDGVGLYRTEFLYLTRAVEPSEEDHFQAYKRCVELLEGRPLTIRTVDLGADKYTQERADTPERNPFLGLRSIRYCLQNTAMFKRQLRAILRASALGPIKIMFPLVTTTGEFRKARWHLNEVMEDLSEEGIAYDAKVPVGMMVEVPAAALMADIFAREVDFFSIGTNDLVQYTLAVDRTNEQVAELFCPTNPAVIRLLKDVVRVARRHRIDVSCCGESAGDLEYALLLIGIGLRTLSVTASTLPHLRRLVRSVSVAECERIARKAGSLDSDAAVSAFLRERARKIIPEAFGGRTAEERV